MPVRNTESRIPAGMVAADLGPAVTAVGGISGEVKVALVSFLPHLIRDKYGILSENTYVAFVEGIANPGPVQYHWTIDGYTTRKAEWSLVWDENTEEEAEESVVRGERSVLQFDLRRSSTIECLQYMSRLRVNVSIEGLPGGPAYLSLQQDIKTPAKHLINGAGSTAGRHDSVAGDPELTRRLGDYYSSYLDGLRSEPGFNEHDDNKKIRLVIARVYGAYLAGFGRTTRPEELWEAYLNRDRNQPGSAPPELVTTPLGVARLYPPVLAMFAGAQPLGPATTALVRPFLLRESVPGGQEAYYQQLLTRFHADVPREAKLDLFNALRFPKSCIRLCGLFLRRLKDRHPAWRTIPWNDFLLDDARTDVLLDEFWRGPTDAPIAEIKHDTKARDLVNQPYTFLISATNRCLQLRTSFSVTIPLKEEDPEKRRIVDEYFKTSELAVENSGYDPAIRPLTRITDRTRRRTVGMFESVYYEVARTVLYMRYNVEDSAQDNVYLLILYRHEWLGEEQTPHPTVVHDPVTDLRLKRNSVHVAYHGRYVQDADGVSAAATTDAELKEAIEKKVAYRIEFVLKRERMSLCLGLSPLASVSRQVIAFLERWVARLAEARRLGVTTSFDRSALSGTLQGMLAATPDADSLLASKPDLPPDGATFNPIVEGHTDLPEDYSLNKTESMEPIRLEFVLDRPRAMADAPPVVLPDPTQLPALLNTLRDWANKAVGPLKLLVVGYADRSFRGTGNRAAYNLQLSQRRVEWFLSHIPADLRAQFAPTIDTEFCGDRYAELPDKNAQFRDIRVILFPETNGL